MESKLLVEVLVGVLLAFIGLVEALSPQMMVKFQIWTQRVVLGATYIPSARTYTFIRYLGIFFLALGGVLIWAGLTR